MAKDVSLVRIKADTNDYERNIKNAQKTWDSFTKGLGLNVGKLTGVAAAIGAVTTAVKVAKDAFMQSESSIDEWGRTVEGAKGAYNTFLNTLNSGNWSNFFDNLATAVKGARDLYDSLDRLGSIKSNNQAAIAIVQQQIAQLRLAKQQGENVDEQLKEATARLAALQKQSVDAGMGAGHNTIVNTLRNRVNALNTTGVGISDGMLKGYAGALENYGQQVFDNMAKVMSDLQKKATVETVNSYTNQYGGTQYTRSTWLDLSKLTEEEQKQYFIAKAITEGEAEIQQGLSLYAQAVSEGTGALREEFKNNRYTLQGSGKGDTNENPVQKLFGIEAQKSIIKDLQEEFDKTDSQYIRGLVKNKLAAETKKLDFMQGKGLEPITRDATSGSLSEKLGIQMPDWSKIKVKPLQDIADAGDAASSSWGEALNSIGGLSSALAAIEDPAVKVLGIIAEAIATVALTFAKSLKGTITPWDWIAGAAAGTATMISTIAAIKSATAGSFAEGGIVPGNSYSGDRLTANVNSGELILSASQQNVLASRLQNNNNPQNLRLTATIKGTDIQLALNNTARQQGRGTYVTAR